LELTRKKFIVINAIISLLFVSLFLPVNAAIPKTQQDHIHFAAFESPLEQFSNNIALDFIQCSEGLEIIMKKSNGMPACVKPTTYAVLIERGWGIHVLPDYTAGNNNSEIFQTGSYKVKTNQANYFQK